MKMKLQGKTIVLTGASSGIGREMTRLFVTRYGANVIGIGRNEEKFKRLKEELGEKFDYVLFDVSVRGNWLNFAEQLQEKGQTIDLLINNAGVFPPFAKLKDVPSERVEQVFQTNFFSMVYAVETMRPLIKKGGGIVNTCSSSALCTVVGAGAYSASKAAIKAYTEGLILEERDKYIGVIYPGTTATELFRENEQTKNSAFDYIAMKPQKMAKKMVKKIVKKSKRAVLGWDAKLMNWTAKLCPVKGLAIICWVMKASKSKVFENVFKDE